VLSLFNSCNFSKEETTANTKGDKKEAFDLYEPSEMSIYMNTMYALNEEVKRKIVAGKDPGVFPKEVMEIHTAVLSDFKSRNETFEAYSKLFVEKEASIFDSLSALPVKQRYNDAINLCISCHRTECLGPIPRIQKLLIK
jgi:hypothetical protein